MELSAGVFKYRICVLFVVGVEKSRDTFGDVCYYWYCASVSCFCELGSTDVKTRTLFDFLSRWFIKSILIYGKAVGTVTGCFTATKIDEDLHRILFLRSRRRVTSTSSEYCPWYRIYVSKFFIRGLLESCIWNTKEKKRSLEKKNMLKVSKMVIAWNAITCNNLELASTLIRWACHIINPIKQGAM